MYPTLLPGKHNESACVVAHSARPRRNPLRNRVLPLPRQTCKEYGVEWEPRRNLLRNRVSPLAVHNLFTPAQMPAIPIPALVGVLGVKGFVLERIQTKVMGKAVLAYSVQSKGTLTWRDDFSLTRAPNFCWTHPQRVLSSSSSLHAGPDKVRIDRSTALS